MPSVPAREHLVSQTGMLLLQLRKKLNMCGRTLTDTLCGREVVHLLCLLNPFAKLPKTTMSFSQDVTCLIFWYLNIP